MFEDIKESFLEFDFDETKRLVRKAVDELRIDPLDVVEKALRPAMGVVGEKFEEGEFFLAELIVSGQLFKEIMSEIIEPKLGVGEAGRRLGTVVIGTVKGDLHDIGKNIVATMLRIAGFEVIDLGVDVPTEKFVEAVEKYRPDILGMSALLTTVIDEIKHVIDALKSKGLRDKVKIVVGGAAVTESFAKEVGADGYGKDAVEAVRVCKKLLGLKD
ncbi:MAG: cobalamin-binding protein [Thermoprotei archaeon]|nr:MAG: cobalamin-binding protein [Thermoprotei archaeon]